VPIRQLSVSSGSYAWNWWKPLTVWTGHDFVARYLIIAPNNGAYLVRTYWNSSRLLPKRPRSINSGLLRPGDFLEVATWIATHPAATWTRRIDSLTEGFGIVTDVSTPVETTCGLQSSDMMST